MEEFALGSVIWNTPAGLFLVGEPSQPVCWADTVSGVLGDLLFLTNAIRTPLKDYMPSLLDLLAQYIQAKLTPKE